MAYCSITEISGMTQPNPPYDSTTNPSTNEVGVFINEISADMNLTIQAAGYALPITGSDALQYLKLVNSWGAGALAEQSNVAQVNENVPDIATDLWNKYQNALGRIRTEPGLFPGEVKVAGRPRALWTSKVADGTDPDVSDISPWIRRDTTF